MKQRGKKVFIAVAAIACFIMSVLAAQAGQTPVATERGARFAHTITDADWVSMNPGIQGVWGYYVNSMTVDASGNLYAAGSFTVAGTVLANNIAKWDGASWSALGSGLSVSADIIYACPVNALAVDASGNLYAGGNFTTAGGITVNGIAKWDGASWSALGSGMSMTTGESANINALALDASGNLYAGGYFTTAGGVTVNGIAKWDGASWSALGSGMSMTTGEYSNVNALAVDGSGNLYAGGSFTTAGGVAVNGLAKWDGASWSALGSGVGGDFEYVGALAFDPSGGLYVGGRFTSAGGITVNNVAKWNGSAWSALGSGMNDNVQALAFDASGNLYAGGDFMTAGGVAVNGIAKWDGSAWSALGPGMGGPYPWVNALAFDVSGTLYAGGQFSTAGGITVNNIAKWDGSGWFSLGASSGLDNSVFGLVSDASGNLYAGGRFTKVGGISVNHIAKWDGASWSALGTGMNGNVQALAVDASGNLYAGGQFSTAGGVTVNNIAKWDGTSWSALGSGMDMPVHALAVDAGNLYAGGQFSTAGGATVNAIAKWNGSSWSGLGSGMAEVRIWSMTSPPVVYALAFDLWGNLYAGGVFAGAGGITAFGIAKWDGRAWSGLGLGVGMTGIFVLYGIPPWVVALAADASGNLYVKGNFGRAGVVGAPGFAKWNGFSWSALEDWSGVIITTLAVDPSGNLYAGGSTYLTTDNVTYFNIAAWDGTSWSALGSGTNGPIKALAVDALGSLYAGGEFTTAGNKVSPYIAKCKLPEQTSTTTTTIGCPAAQALGADNPNLESLRDFRDSSLAQSSIGMKVIQIYYTNAAGINAALERSPVLRAIARRALETIAPMVGRKE